MLPSAQEFTAPPLFTCREIMLQTTSTRESRTTETDAKCSQDPDAIINICQTATDTLVQGACTGLRGEHQSLNKLGLKRSQ